jgi:hypothetical protein
MQRKQWILIGSLGTLVLCAMPYGCSGKYVGGDRDGQQTATDGHGSSAEPGDGVGHSVGTSVNHEDGYPYVPADGTSNSWGDGTLDHGDGVSDPIQLGEGVSDGDYSEGYFEHGDGVSACCDGYDDYGAGSAEGAPDGSP